MGEDRSGAADQAEAVDALLWTLTRAHARSKNLSNMANREVKTMATRKKPTQYHTKFVTKVKRLVAAGESDAEIARQLQVTRQTLRNWQDRYPAFDKAMTRDAAAQALRDEKRGPPEKYQKSFDRDAYKLCLLGMINAELATFFEVCESTIDHWIRDKPTFRAAVRRGKALADANVAESLYKRAMGYSHPDTHFAVIDGRVVQTPHVKHYPPDSTAMVFWLKNRQRRLWRDRRDFALENADELTPWTAIEAGIDDGPDEDPVH